MAANFVALSIAEVACRATSVGVFLYLARVLSKADYGRIEFAFNVVFWLVLLVRDGLEVIAAREIARHPRLIRPLVNHVLAVKGLLALGLLGGLVVVGRAALPHEGALLTLYGLLLLTTALGLDFVFRGTERMGLVAVSLILRTAIYAAGVGACVAGAENLARVPACLVAGEACGIALVWACYARRYGLPRPALGGRFLRVFLRRGKRIYLIQIGQTVLGSVDLMVVAALMSRWADFGLYVAPHKIVAAVLAFGLIVQQVVFPALARSWRDRPESGRRALDAWVRVLVSVMLPLAVGATVLAGPLVRLLIPKYPEAAPLLALGIWRAPLLTLAFLYQSALIALSRESVGLRLLLIGAAGSVPLATALGAAGGLPGAAAGVVLAALALTVAGHRALAAEGRQPAWHHHLARPLAASLMMVPACLLLARVHVLLAVPAGALTYFLALAALGGLRREELGALIGRGG